MKNKFLTMLLLCSVSWGQVWAAEESSKLPLPDSGNVTLTLDEYNRLVELASKPPKKTDVPPLPYSIKHADVKLHVENDSVLGSVLLDGEVFHKGMNKVPLTTGMTILDAHDNGKVVALEQENGTHTALLPGPGEFSVALETGMPLRIEAGRASFSLPVPNAGSVQLALVIPGDHTYAYINPGLITSRKSENGHTTIEATLAPGQPTNIWWATREFVVQAPPREVRFLADAKTLISVSESEIRAAVLADITVVQGETAQFKVQLPDGWEVTGVTGASLDSSQTEPQVVNQKPVDSDGPAHRVLLLRTDNPGVPNHQFLISMERSVNDAKAETPFVTFVGAQRETGEVLLEGAGTIELTANEGGGVKRMDVKEVNPYLRSLAHYSPQAAFRYHKQPNESPTLALQWVRYPDGSVLGAVAESAQVTTMVTSEGKSLTEIKLTVKNQAQPFLKVALPSGVTILSAEVAGEPVKPVQGPDGSRVPLLRPKFRPTDAYEVSFVFMHSGAPFAKKGGAELSLPGMDIPISLLTWEVFLPDQFKVKDFGGDVIAANRVPEPFREEAAMSRYEFRNVETSSNSRTRSGPQQMGGYVSDQTGAVMPYARVTITSNENGATRIATTDAQGHWVLPEMPSGNYKAKVEMPGFKTGTFNLNYNSNQPSMYAFPLTVASASETVEVTAQSPQIDKQYGYSVGGALHGVVVQSEVGNLPINGRDVAQASTILQGTANQNASANVVNLQKRVAGVLPVPIDVPRAGTSFAFVRPLVLDEETKVTFSYKSR